MNISIRLEEEKDFKIVEYMTREAFWDLYKPGCDEHLVLHKIRKVPVFVKELDFVACDEDTIVGNIIYSRAKVLNEENQIAGGHPTLKDGVCFGPPARLFW
ncbi:GNAT family N-acetyltransferase [Methanosarcina mazei]|nr:N-acetyltransferase [Methanosarcina mazei]